MYENSIVQNKTWEFYSVALPLGETKHCMEEFQNKPDFWEGKEKTNK